MGLTLQRFPDGIGSFTPRVDSHLLYKRKGVYGSGPRHRGAVRPLRPRRFGGEMRTAVRRGVLGMG